MSRLNRENIDRKTNKPSDPRTDSFGPDKVLNRAEQIRRDDDVFRTPRRTPYDIDYALLLYLKDEIQPQVTHDKEIIQVPVIFSNGEKWDTVRRLGYLRDEKDKMQSPVIMIKRNSFTERESLKHLDVNRQRSDIARVYKNKYNKRNRYEDKLFPIPDKDKMSSEELVVVDIPKYVTIEYELLLWCDFTTQMNELVTNLYNYNRYSWGNEQNRFGVYMNGVTFETVNTVGQDRLVRATIPMTAHATLLSSQELRRTTLQKQYSIKKVSFDISVDESIFNSTVVPQSILQANGGIIVTGDGTSSTLITGDIITYLKNLTDKTATYFNPTTVQVTGTPAYNPYNNSYATLNEFDVYINGQYIDSNAYTWNISTSAPQTITFDPSVLGYSLTSLDVVVINGRWA